MFFSPFFSGIDILQLYVLLRQRRGDVWLLSRAVPQRVAVPQRELRAAQDLFLHLLANEDLRAPRHRLHDSAPQTAPDHRAARLPPQLHAAAQRFGIQALPVARHFAVSVHQLVRSCHLVFVLRLVCSVSREPAVVEETGHPDTDYSVLYRLCVCSYWLRVARVLYLWYILRSHDDVPLL